MTVVDVRRDRPGSGHRVAAVIPGARSIELAARRAVAVPTGLASSMNATAFVTGDDKASHREAVAEVVRYAQTNGVMTLAAGTFGTVLRFLPPARELFTHTTTVYLRGGRA